MTKLIEHRKKQEISQKMKR